MGVFRRMFEGWAGLNRAPTAESAERMRRQRYQNVFSGEDGRWVLADLARQHHVLTEIQGGNELTPVALAIAEGRRSVVVNLIKYCDQPFFDESGE